MTKKLLFGSLAALLAEGIFAATCAAVWPVRQPKWAVRVSSAVYLAGIITLTAAVLAWLWTDGRTRL